MKLKPMGLRPGDMLDLEGDPYADPTGDDQMLVFEYACVESVGLDGPLGVKVETTAGDVYRFPLDHELKCDARGCDPYTIVVNTHGVDFTISGSHIPRVYICEDVEDAEAWVGDREDCADGRYGIDFPCGVSEREPCSDCGREDCPDGEVGA